VRVGVIAYPLDRPIAGGIDRYVHRLAAEFSGGPHAAEFVWIHGSPFPGSHPLHGAQEVLLPERGLAAAVRRRRWGRANAEKLDVLWGPYFGILPGPYAKVITVHDLYALSGRDGGRLQTARFRAVTRRMVNASDWVIVDSEATRRQVLGAFSIEPTRVRTIHLAADRPPKAGPPREAQRAALRGAHGWPADAQVVLFVSTFVQRKDPATLVRAFAALHRRLPSARLLFFGHAAGASGALQRALEAAGLGAAGAGGAPVAFAKDLTDGALEIAYAGADVLSLPSIFEGFGIPVLEAMARGLPTVLSTGGSLPEIGGDAAIYHAVGDDAALADALERILTEPAVAASMSVRGSERAAAFSWARAAEETLAVLEEAARRG
jgi:alpha-1,3-rhamnosyl/mannosyltransferase